MPFFRHLFHGFLVGIAGLLPGLCGSTLLVLFGLYRPLTAALAHPFADVRRNLVRFGPFFLAAGAGILVGSRALATIFARHETATLFLFMGFMLGVLPDLFGENQGMIGTGSMEGDTFVAKEILAKHDESYMPKEVVDALKEQGVYKDPNS